MKILLVDRQWPDSVHHEAAAYVAELAPLLAENHRVTVVTIPANWLKLPFATARISRALQQRPDVVHVNNLQGVLLAAVLSTIGRRAPVAIGLHDNRLRQGLVFLNRAATAGAGMAIGPSSDLLEQHRADGFFRTALGQVIPYQMPYHAERLLQAYRDLLIHRRVGGLDNRAA
jgi:hypothetical protein